MGARRLRGIFDCSEEMGPPLGFRTLTGDAKNRFEKKTRLEDTQMTGLLLELFFTDPCCYEEAEPGFCAVRGLLRLASPPLVRAVP